MPHFHRLPIMPKASGNRSNSHSTNSRQPSHIHTYPMATATATSTMTADARQGSIWSDEEDELLRQGRAADLSWPMIRKKYFPHKTPNACRKRHERLMEQRRGEDWDMEKLGRLAQEYLVLRREMWEILASRIGERWNVVEAKCMETGLKNLSSIARTAQRKAAAGGEGSGSSGSAESGVGRASSFDDQDQDQGTDDRHSDSGIGLCSDAEMEAGGPEPMDLSSSTNAAATTGHSYLPDRPQPPRLHQHQHQQPQQHEHQHQHHQQRQQQHHYPFDSHHTMQMHHPRQHIRAGSFGGQSSSFLQQLPLYQPPPPLSRPFSGAPLTSSPTTMAPGPFSSMHQRSRFTPEAQSGRAGGISIQSVLAPAESQRI